MMFPMVTAVTFALSAALPQQADVVVRYPCNEGSGSEVRDGLTGTVKADWATSPSGTALSFDGSPSSIVTVQVPQEFRFGKGSWTFAAWLKPVEFGYPDAQNQRRVFSYGAFPEANIVVDIFSTGQPSCYLCYRRADGQIVSAGATSGVALKRDQWAHVAVVGDRARRVVQIYVNGLLKSEESLPAGFDGDYSVSGELTLGSSWHNYHGLMDEVLVVRRALSRQEVRAEFRRMADVFGVSPSAEEKAAENRAMLMEKLEVSDTAAQKGDWEASRGALREIVASTDAAGSLKSYAHLRLARSYEAEKRWREAREEYLRISRHRAYPSVHRQEAAERAKELERVLKGLPARDPRASRVRVSAVGRFAAEVAVAPNGDDRNDGVTKPAATLTRARDLVRALRRKGVQGPICVRIAPGTYRVTAPLVLSEHDSGLPKGVVVYRAEKPGMAVFYGGQRIRGFQPATDPAILARLPEESRGRVVQCDLRAQGITDYGRLAVRGFGQPPSPPTLEVFFNGNPLTLARWPNRGFVGIKRLVEPGDRSQGKPSVFEYVDDRHARWVQAEEPWLFGYFRYLWADATIRVTRIDPESRTVICGEAYHYGVPGMDTGQGIQYYAFNLLEEIDEPGEWYLDRQNGILYLYPPSDPEKAVVEIGMLQTPMVVAEKVHHVRFEGLTFDLGRYNAMELKDCSDVLVAGCTVRRFAGNGIMVHGGERVGILSCHIHTIGRRATEVIGGDRQTLTPARHFVENCEIHDFGRIDRTYTPAIQLEGVGNRAAHNLMYNCPSSVMRIEGNDHVIEFNDVRDAVRESDDQGAMELFGNPTYRGVVFRFNRFVDCGKRGGAQVHGQAAIRLDDVISGMVLYGNVFVRSANGHFGAVQINSGRDNIMDNNLFVECDRGISGGWYGHNPVWRQVAEKQNPDVFIQSDLYMKRYPEMTTMLKEPGVNYVWRNLFVRCGPMVTGNRAHLEMLGNVEIQSPVSVTGQSLGVDEKLLARMGFRPIPLGEIGMYRDAYRPQVKGSRQRFLR